MKDTQNNPQVPAEILFAQHLAANEKKIRDRALRKLQRYLVKRSSCPSGGFDEAEFLKIWKGLHYCMWMQDKPLIHEELSDGICKLVHCFPNKRNALLYIKTFYMTECREWSSIDKWRMDKFLMLFRGMLTEAFEYLKKQKWLEKLVDELLDFLETYILCDHAHERCPDGVRFHLTDIYLTELERVSKGELGPRQALRFLQPWVNVLTGIKQITFRAYVVKNIFGDLIQAAPAFTGRPRPKNSIKLRVNYRLLADMLMEAGGSEKCRSKNKTAIYSLVNNFKALAEGKLPYDPDEQIVSDVEDLNDDDIENAIERLAKFDQELRAEDEKLKPKKRKMNDVEDDEADGNNDLDDDDLPYGSEEGEDMDDYGSDDSLDLDDEDDGEEDEQPVYQPPKKMKKAAQVPVKQETQAKTKGKSEKKKIYSKKLNQLLQAEKEYLDDKLEHDSDGEIDQEASATSELNGSTEGEKLVQNGHANKKNKKKTQKLKPKEDQNQNHASPDSSNSHKGADLTDNFEDAEVDGSKVPMVEDAPFTKNQNKNRKSKPVTATEQSKKLHSKKSLPQSKKAPAKLPNKNSSDFEVENFPNADGEVNMESLISPGETQPLTSSKKSKKTKSQPTASLSATCTDSAALANFTSNSTTKVSAKYFKKAMSKSGTPQTTSFTLTTSTEEVVKSEKKRISFGQSQSVKKTDVKIKGRLSFDPSKTPEQGILKVNPITPGTVIQVGKQATMMNTLKNSKFPGRMLASDFF